MRATFDEPSEERLAPRPHSFKHHLLRRVGVFWVMFAGMQLDVWAFPAPTATSTVGADVTNPVNGHDVKVLSLITDPAGTPTAGTVAFVRTDDGYVFLVKAVNEIVYNGDTPPLGFKIISQDTMTHTVQLQAQTNPVSATNATLGYQIPYTDLQTQLLGTDTAGAVTAPVAVAGATGVRIVNTGDNGSNGRAGALFVPPNGGGDGAGGPAASYTTTFNISTTNQIGLEVGSVGGKGGKGGSSYLSFWSARDGGNGGAGGTATAINDTGFQIATTGTDMYGIYAYSRSGKAGDGGDSILAVGGGTGGHSSNAGNVVVENRGTIITIGDGAFGIYGLSVSNNGGDGGDSWGLVGSSGSASYGGNGGNVSITNAAGAQISTTGVQAHGILAQSIGGSGGSAGISGQLIVALSGSGDNGGSGGTVDVTNGGTILTSGDSSRGIFAQSIGGGGGTGGTVGGLISVGGSGSNGGSANAVTVKNLATGVIQTQGFNADGIVAQSIGGSGGSGSDAYGLVAVGGSGTNAGNGGTVSVENYGQISTLHAFSRGIVAQSIGGGGGDGGSSGGMVSVGGSGDGGGFGQTVTVKNGGSITTVGADSIGVLAQSIGGGGGNGGSAGSVGLFAGVAVGGKGSKGGAGGDVDLIMQGKGDGTTSLISTAGARSEGIFAQSVGGGGGNGGGSFSVSVGFGAAASFAIGGAGDVGGAGGSVTLTKGTGTSWVQTAGADSAGVFLQSVGGGGGNGGYALSLAVSGGPASGSLGLAIGGTGSKGAAGGSVTVGTFAADGTMTTTGFNGTVLTKGERSTGFLAQSIGGGGGNGGLAVAGAASFSPSISGSITIGLGGSGGGGGEGGKVQVGIEGNITTQGDNSTALLAQSVGGGGGNGGGSIAAALAIGQGAGSIGISLGGEGGTASKGGDVNVATRSGTIRTEGSNSTAILIQSVGGGGGNGGYAIAAAAAGASTGAGAVDIALGGKGGAGGDGGNIKADLQSNVETSSVMRAIDPNTNEPIPPYAENSSGVVVQSVGGGGGNGGFSVGVGVAGAGQGSGAISVGLGGKGAAGGKGGTVEVTSTGKIDTLGDRSAGLVAQSVGGGGGNGGYNVSVAGSAAGVGSGAITVGLGGSAGTGNTGGLVTLHTLTGKISTAGADSIGVLAQSIGGGGGNGGFNLSLSASGSGNTSGAISVGLGGSGGTGAHASTVNLTVENAVSTVGRNSAGVVAQSIGGGGGNGGYNVSLALSGASSNSGAITVGLGGSGAGGGDGRIVIASTSGKVTTDGDDSAGIVAQSIGGGGGNGGFDVSVAGSGAGTASGAISVGLGGSGSGGGNAGTVNLTVANDVVTKGKKSTGILAQSIGGGGGNGGFDVTAALSGSTNSGVVGVGIGGSAGTGGFASAVTSSITGNVTTSGEGSGGIFSQSLGGGGGYGGMSIVGALSFASNGSGAVSVGLGGSGGGGGNAGTVTSTVSGTITTSGADGFGVISQSLGGGGGAGGMSISGAISIAKTGAGAVGIGLGGVGGDGGDADAVTSTFTGYVQTSGSNAPGIVSQSLGGGGGNGGLNITGTITAAKEGSGSIAFGMGGFGGDGGVGKDVTSTVTGGVSTSGISSDAIVSQSFGGGGGNGGLNVTGTVNLSQKSGGTLGVGLGGFGGVGGNAGSVTSTVTTTVAHPTIQATGNNSSAVVAQSYGGGGGNGGINITGAVNLTGENGAAIGVGIGGFGGGAGNGGNVTANVSGQVSGSYIEGHGILAQSIGGGGGDGGINITGTLAVTQSKGTSSTAVAASIGVGGFGAGGGTGGVVDVTYAGSTLSGFQGLAAQSIGGGGGNGGLNVSAGIAYGSGDGDARGLVIGVGGFGGAGGNANTVDVRVTGAGQITAVNAGILAQSIGGGGGNGGTNVSGSITSNSPLIVGVGGMGADAGVANNVTVAATANFSLYGNGIISSAGIMAQSIGGGGGNGGVDVTGGLVINKTSSLPSVNVGVGGFGGAGSISGDVTVTQTGNIVATGNWAHGILAQSIAGGGGNGGLNVSGQFDFAASDNSGGKTDLTIVAGVGGNAGLGADAGDVVVTQNGAISTSGDHSLGLIAQSIGGGGGMGGMNFTGVLARKSSPIQVGVGGSGAGGGDAGSVIVTRGSATTATGQIATNGQSSHGIEASSIGGGGGDAGMNINLGLTQAGAGTNPPGFAASFTIGGSGGVGAVADFVQVNNYSSIYTAGANSHGILAQSIGGGGGNASFNVGVIYGGASDANKENKNLGFALTIGGGTGDGGHGATVQVVQKGNVETMGAASYGVVAQSIGGGGGNAGLDFGMDIVDGGSASITIGRHGGTGGYASAVSLSSNGTIITHGKGSYGLLAQSVGNGGGNSSATTVGVSGPKTKDSASQGFAVSVGLEGGEGGYAGDVLLNAQGFIDTFGEDAHGIFAQSVGGGGGNGGSANTMGLTAVTVGISIGGLGGGGGHSGVVSVTSSAQVRTYGNGSVGILAQSIGGGGGNGGMSTSGGWASEVDGITIGVGGSGREGMYGGKVFVDNSGVIITDGIGSHGILAQSLGGGGGNSGLVLNATLKDNATEASYRASISVGGTGGEGGTGGDVDVTNTGGIGTQKENSMGIFAQSVGGGGGNAGTVITAAVSNDKGGANTAISIGGTGGKGGAGGKVTVTNETVTGDDNAGKIITVGAQSHGIAAMSVGGGGGTGSTTISLLRSSGASSTTTTTGLIFSLGGSGGEGGTGGAVNVENQGSITTYGQKAFGILAQSIGGGGGDGGVSVTGDLAFGKKAGNNTPGEIISVAIGGTGGSGDAAGKVTVINSGSIEVKGLGSAGIYAQSVGGGGGNGAFAATLSKNLFTNPFTSLLPALTTIGMGGFGGDGADGGDVVVEHSGTIIARGDKSYGIFAQSVAGGGGEAGFALTAPVWMAADLVANVLLGARDGSEGQVGTVSITTTGTITMYGAKSKAQFAQTISGGGGNVNRFLDLSQQGVTIDTSGAIVLPNNGGYVDTAIGFITSNVTLGADAVSGLIGKGIDATHVGDLYTYGEKSIASLMQSIGGGGGNDDEDIIVNTTTRVDLALALGATNSSNNSGGDITATRTGDVATSGSLSGAGGVQTIGGGGGNLSLNASQVPDGSPPPPPPPLGFGPPPPPPPAPGVFATALLGADGSLPGSSSDGGNVTINYTGAMTFTGDRSPGPIFQSLGAGGGIMTLTGLTQLNLGVGGINGASGNGGNLSITNTGLISTTGLLSNGIVVQSIGGGGGVVSTDLDAADISITKNTGNIGNGGNLVVTQNGNVVATGNRSSAVILQSLGGGGGLVDDLFAGSAGGVGNSGTITFAMNGSVNAGGTGGVGIFAQSSATGTQGNIVIGLAAAQTLYFGTGGAGVHISGGATNVFTNNGSVIGADLLTGWGVLGEAGNEAVVNNGLFVGQVNLGAGTNSFTNACGAALLLGPQFFLGAASNQLTNNGILRPGGTGLAQHTNMTGSFTQTSTGTTFAEVDFGTNAIDQVYMNGTTKLAGRIDAALLNPQVIGIGHFEKVLFHADGGVTNDGAILTTLPSVVITYDLLYPSTGTDAILSYDVNFNPPGSNFGRNLLEVGGYFNNIQKAGSSPGLAPTIIALLYAPDINSYREMLSQLGPDFYGEQQAEMLRGSQRFGESILNGGSTRYSLKDRMIWLDFLSSNTVHGAYDDFKTVRQQTVGFALGFEDFINAHWSVGLAVSYEDNSANGYQGHWNANGSSERFGSMVRYKNSGSEIAAMISLGWNSMDSTRAGQVAYPFNTQVNRDMQTLTAMVRFAHEFVSNDFYIKPQVDLGVTHLSAGAATENGGATTPPATGSGSATNLALLGYFETRAWVRPALTIRKAILVTKGTRISFHTEFGYQYYLNGNDTYVRAGFAGAPPGVDTMNVPINLGSMATMSVGLQLSLMDDLSMGIYYTKALAKHYHLDLYNFRFNKSF